jgi:hypothetical protein
MQRLSGKSRAGHIDSNVRHSAPKSNALEIPSQRSGEVTTGRLERRGCGQRPSSGTTFRTTAARCGAGRSISHTNVSEEFSARTDLERRPTQHPATLKSRHGGVLDILTDTLTLRSTSRRSTGGPHPLEHLADATPDGRVNSAHPATDRTLLFAHFQLTPSWLRARVRLVQKAASEEGLDAM